MRSMRKLRCASFVRSQLCTYHQGSSRSRACGSIVRTLVSSPTAVYSISTSRCSVLARESVAMSCSSAVTAWRSGPSSTSNSPKVSSSLRRTRSSGVWASAAIIGPTNSSASRMARASSGVSLGGRRNVSPKSSFST